MIGHSIKDERTENIVADGFYALILESQFQWLDVVVLIGDIECEVAALIVS